MICKFRNRLGEIHLLTFTSNSCKNSAVPDLSKEARVFLKDVSKVVQTTMIVL